MKVSPCEDWLTIHVLALAWEIVKAVLGPFV